ncbi:MAG TPA: hypothetical protein P5266_00260, partial [Candidatus Fermentibacter sp.]|nr:hypothetical protein [Candidatus Fermentibacter sp.]
ESAVLIAQAQLEKAKAQLALVKAGARAEDIAVAQAPVNQAEVGLAEAKNALTDAVLMAPFAGTVGTILLEEGELAAPQAPVIILGDESVLRVRTLDLGEADVSQVQVGQHAVVTVDAPGPLSFSVGLEDFSKDAPAGWDGSVDAFLVTLFPTAGLELLDGFEVFAGPGAVYLSGDYSGTDRYGRFVEADGASVGFGFSAGGEISISGPLSGRLEYRRTFMDLSTGSAVVDGTGQSVYPAEETDLGYSQFGFALVVSILGGEGSLLGGL